MKKFSVILASLVFSVTCFAVSSPSRITSSNPSSVVSTHFASIVNSNSATINFSSYHRTANPKSNFNLKLSGVSDVASQFSELTAAHNEITLSPVSTVFSTFNSRSPVSAILMTSRGPVSVYLKSASRDSNGDVSLSGYSNSNLDHLGFSSSNPSATFSHCSLIVAGGNSRIISSPKAVARIAASNSVSTLTIFSDFSSGHRSSFTLAFVQPK